MATDQAERLRVRDRAAWRAWLAEHHEASSGVWLTLSRTGGVIPG
jgi:hypothetical protein